MTRLHEELPVESLSARSWDRIEDGVFRSLDGELPEASYVGSAGGMRRLWRWPAWTAAGAVAVAAALVAIVVTRGGDSRLPVSSRVATEGAPSRVSVGDADLTVAPQSALVVHGDDQRGVLVVLERGRVECAVAPRDGRPPFVVMAGDVRVTVVGTRFSVERHGDRAVVEVVEGVVRVVDRGEETLVRAGEAWPAEAEAEAEAEADAEADEAEADAEADADAEAEADADAVADAEADAVAEVGEAGVGSKLRERGRARRPREHRRPRDAAEVAAPVRTARERFESAARLERTDPEAAIAMYAELATDKGAWAANALYAQARLELDLGHRARARRLLRSYLRRFPDGLNAGDARALLDEER